MTRSGSRLPQFGWLQQSDNSNNHININNNNNAAAAYARRRRFYFVLLRSLQLWTLLAVTIWSVQFLLVTHLTRSELAGKHSLVHGDHQRHQQQQQQRQKLSSSLSHPLLQSRASRTNSALVLAKLGKKQSAVIRVQQPASNNNDHHKANNEDRVKKSFKEQEINNNDDDDEQSYYNCTNENGELVTLQQVPAFIIIGAQKAGTSALYDLLNLHPNLQGSHEPEAHFFDRRLPINDLRNATNTTWADEYRCKVRETYAKKFFPYEQLQNNPYVKFFDKTPDYIVSTGAPFRIQAIAPWSKIILSLRNPVHRAFSQHRMETRPSMPHLTFEERLGMNLDTLRQHLPHYYFNASSSADAPPPPADPFPRPSQELLDRLPQPKHQEIQGFDMWKHRNVIYRGLYLEQLKPWLQYNYTLGKNLLVVRYEDFQRHPEAVLHQILDFVGVERRHPAAAAAAHQNGTTTTTTTTSLLYTPEILSAQYGPGRLRGTPGEIAEVDPPLPASLEFLQQFYKPYNDALAHVLGDEWRGVWD